MLESANTEERILALMKKGARLVYYIDGGDVEVSPFVTRIAIEHNGNSVTLAVIERWDSEGVPYSAHSNAADRIRRHPDIRSAYAGYRGDFDRSWREVYEHEDMPVPVWIREQWNTPISQYDDDAHYW